MAAGRPLLLIVFVLCTRAIPVLSCFPAIFSFGDSLADTGNLLALGGGHIQADQLPYGETYFHRPTGRHSDGRLVIDFVGAAQEMGLPLVPPYLAGSAGKDFGRGVNFAVAGATALSNDFFRDKGLSFKWPNKYSLDTQIQLFQHLLPSLCSSVIDCNDMISNSLFLVGEIGVNDYTLPLFHGRTLDEIQTYVPSIIKAISSAITVLIELGAKGLVVPGIFPMGCDSLYLTILQSQKIEVYEPETGCIKRLNELVQYHNRLLKVELDELGRRYTGTTIIYSDYYEAVMSIVRSPQKYGFNNKSLVACCGGGGLYNYDFAKLCGEEGSMSCDDPSRYIGWDGVHFTEATYKIIAIRLMKELYDVSPIAYVCSHKAATQSISKKLTNPLVSPN